MLMAELHTYLLEKKLVAPLFVRPRDSPPLSGFYLSKKCENHFGAKGNTLKECTQLRYQIQDLIDNKLIQLDNAIELNVITNPLPPHPEGNVNAISTMEEKILDFSSLLFPWKAML